MGNDIIQSFFAALVISAWSEVMARLRKCPVTSYLLVALFPLVPGGGIYYTMEHALNGDTELFLDTLMHTLGLAGALASGRAAGGLRSPPVHHLPVPPPGLREERYHAPL